MPISFVLFATSFSDVRILSESGSGGAGGGGCPCLSSSSTSLPNNNQVVLAGKTYDYPATYGLDTCKAHDEALAPYCSETPKPEWCSDSWCYVDADNCDDLVTTQSVYFPGLAYSYSTCGDANTFDEWFPANSASTHSLVELTTLVGNYLKSMAEALEDNVLEVGGATCSIEDSCGCASGDDEAACKKLSTISGATPDWGKPDTDPEITFSKATTTPRTAGDYSGAQGNLEKCLSSIVGSSFQRIAAKESVISRVGYAYGAFQRLGTYMQWPGVEWCPDTYDPRYRPWYAAAAAGPKDVVVVVDVSGSMTGSRIGMARDAAKAVLDTLTEADYASIIVFSSRADAYSTTLVQATEANKALMEAFIDREVVAGGTTDFIAALSKVKEVLGDGSTGNGCNRVVLFMSDGQPDAAPDTDALKADLDAIGNVRLMTYALGDGAQADVLKSMACENGGVFQSVPDNGDLAYAMAMYYQVLAPSLAPCQTRWTEYTDIFSKKKLLAACVAAFNKTSATAENSCNGGLDGIGDSGSPEVAQLLGRRVHGHGHDRPSGYAQEPLGVRRLRRRGDARAERVLAAHRLRPAARDDPRQGEPRVGVRLELALRGGGGRPGDEQRGGLGGAPVRRRGDRPARRRDRRRRDRRRRPPALPPRLPLHGYAEEAGGTAPAERDAGAAAGDADVVGGAVRAAGAARRDGAARRRAGAAHVPAAGPDGESAGVSDDVRPRVA